MECILRVCGSKLRLNSKTKNIRGKIKQYMFVLILVRYEAREVKNSNIFAYRGLKC